MEDIVKGIWKDVKKNSDVCSSLANGDAALLSIGLCVDSKAVNVWSCPI